MYEAAGSRRINRQFLAYQDHAEKNETINFSSDIKTKEEGKRGRVSRWHFWSNEFILHSWKFFRGCSSARSRKERVVIIPATREYAFASPLPDDCSQYLHSCSLRWSKEPWRCANKRFSTSSRRANFYIVFPFTGALFLLHFRKNGFESWIYVTDKSPENIPKDLSPPVSANGFSSLSLLSFFLPSFFSYLPFHPPLFSPATRFFQHQQVAR